MPGSGANILDDLAQFVRSCGIDLRTRNMNVEKPGEFDGPSLTINPKHDRQALSFYVAHALGSIYQWSTDFEHSQKVFNDLREAKKTDRFETALERWRLFEQSSSDYAVWVLDHIGHADAIERYTVFFRADIEAMTIFHRTGKEPRWPDFFAEWRQKVARGEIRVEPFHPKPMAAFKPVKIEKQEVLQERD
jgi:hypothetical protein